jgi:hypothetical protein
MFYSVLLLNYIVTLIMLKPNYAFDKRQKEIAKQKKKEEKRLQKAAAKDTPAETESKDSDDPDEK